MTTKENILLLLENRKGEYISGEQLASQLGLSRTAVWKAVSGLKEDGFEIESAGRLGYRLPADSDMLSAAAVESRLKNHVFGINIVHETGSTNDDAKALAEKGAPEFTVIAAHRQTRGKGRLGRKFYSPQGTGIYFSIILRPDIPITESLYITTAAAAATARAIEDVTGRKAGIKWVNDIFADGKKVCGILTEASIDMETGRMQYAVLGIGVNVRSPEGGFPDDIKNVAGYLCTPEDYVPGTRSRLLAAILDNFYDYYRQLSMKTFFDEYVSRSILIGKEVTVLHPDHPYTAIVKGIDENCRLLISADGKDAVLDSGEVSVKLI